MAFNAAGLFSESFNPATINKPSFVNFMVRMFPRGAHPLFAMSDYFKPLPGGPVVRTEHGYHVKQFMFGSLKIDKAANYVAGDTTLVVDSTAGVVAGMTFQVPATREVIRIASVTDATTVVVTRAFGRVTAGAILDNAVLFCVGNAHTEASTRPVARTSTSTYVPNYTGIIRNAWGISNSAAASATQLSGYNNLAETKEECAMFHSLDWERMAVWSQPMAPATDAATGKRVHATQGIVDAIYQYASGNVFTAGATTTLAQLETMLNASLNNNNSLSNKTERVVLTDTLGYQVVSNIGRIETKDKVVMDYGVTSFGTRYNKFRSTFGDFTFVEDQVFNANAQPTGMMMVIDPDVIGVGYLGGRDAVQESFDGAKDSHDEGLDAKVGGLLTEMVVCTLVPGSCCVINGITAAA
jgi:hypothetical protein